MIRIAIISLAVLSFSCSEKKDECVGSAKENCVCTMDYSPVCGCDNKTYSNACNAECNGITDYAEGACK